jgi:hypothetical protein
MKSGSGIILLASTTKQNFHFPPLENVIRVHTFDDAEFPSQLENSVTPNIFNAGDQNVT